MAELAGERFPGDGGGFAVGTRVDGVDHPFLEAAEVDVLGGTHAFAGGNQRVAGLALVEAEATTERTDLLLCALLGFSSFFCEVLVDDTFCIDGVILLLFLHFFHNFLYFYFLLTYPQNISFFKHVPFFGQRFNDNPGLLPRF